MNDLLQRLFDLDPPKRLAVYGGAMVVLAGLFWWLFFSPISAELQEKRALVESLETEKAAKSRQVARLPQVRDEVRELDARLRAAVAQLPDQKEIPDLLTQISTGGREAGLEILVFRQKPETYQEFYAEVPVEMVMRGSYRQLVAFLDSVSRLNRIVNVTNITLRKPEVREDVVILDTSATATTFRFLSEAERARIAAEKAAREANK